MATDQNSHQSPKCTPDATHDDLTPDDIAGLASESELAVAAKERFKFAEIAHARGYTPEAGSGNYRDNEGNLWNEYGGQL